MFKIGITKSISICCGRITRGNGRAVTRAGSVAIKAGGPILNFKAINSRSLHSANVFLNEHKKSKPLEGNSKHLGSFKVDQPKLMIAFTCKKCDTRSSHTMSKQAYTKGTVLIKCPGCSNRHLIADHLKIFNDNRITIEDILKAKGESVSQTTDDLVFEDIPDSLKKSIGHYAKNAPEEMRKQLDNDTIHALPHNSKDNKH